MKRKNRKKAEPFLSKVLCMTLIAAIALFTAGCSDKTAKEAQPSAETKTETDLSAEAGAEPEASAEADAETPDSDVQTIVYGEESEELTQFTLTVTDQEGKETQFFVHTDKETVGEALLDLDLIAGEEGEFGLYVKTVNGITADYDTDGTYWAFYDNGEYAQTGVDSTVIREGGEYAFKIEK